MAGPLRTAPGEYGDDEQRIRRQLATSDLPCPRAATTTPSTSSATPPTWASINIALEAIEDANKAKLEGVFRNIDFNSEANLGRTSSATSASSTCWRTSRTGWTCAPRASATMDIIGDAYEYLIGKFASDAGKKAGEFYTPPEVCQLLAGLLDPQPGDRICDPACGSGSLVIKCAKHVGSDDYALYGQEVNGAPGRWHDEHVPARHNVTGHRVGRHAQQPGCHRSQTLMRFNVVVANPPFSLDKWGAEGAAKDRFNRFHRGVPPASKGDYAFISHMIETTLLDPTEHGRVGVVVPHGVLFRGGAEGRIRQQLIEDNLLDAVIGLPANLFYGTGIPAAILLFRRDKTDDSVLFIDASREYEQGVNQNRLREQDRAKIVQTYRQRRSVDKYAYVATRARLRE